MGMVLNKDIWYLISVAVMTVLVTHFGLQKVSQVNPDLFELITGSTRLERFAEAQGFYTPVAVPDTYTFVQGSGPHTLDVLVNDYDEDSDSSLSLDAEAQFDDSTIPAAAGLVEVALTLRELTPKLRLTPIDPLLGL